MIHWSIERNIETIIKPCFVMSEDVYLELQASLKIRLKVTAVYISKRWLETIFSAIRDCGYAGG
jgi:hypothetical protein